MKISEVINSSWFKAALAGAAGVALLVKGIAFGVGARELLLAFKK